MRAYTLADLLAAINDPLRVLGGSDVVVRRVAPITSAPSDAVTFCSAGRADATELIAATAATVIICAPDAATRSVSGKALIVVDEPRLTFARLVARLFAPERLTGIHPDAIIHPEATLANDIYVGPHAVVGRCEIGSGSVIHAHVTLYDDVRIGQNVTVHAGTVIGADGFGYARTADGSLEQFPHVGGVIIEDDVEIGANTCIDRGTLGDTVIRKGAKLDNLVHVAHNVIVGRHALVIAHAMIGGSTVIGDGAWIAPSSALRDGIRIGAQATVGLAAVVVKDVDAGVTVMGAPARPADEYKVTQAKLRAL